MRRLFFLILIVLTAAMIMAIVPIASAKESPRIFLYTYYRQLGWGDRVQIGSVDTDGTVRFLSGHDAELKWPYTPEDQLEYLSQTYRFSVIGTMPHDDLFAAESLVFSTAEQEGKPVSAANDAGTEKSFAVRYAKDGTGTPVLLGMSGDEVFENTDPNAQSLYLTLRRLFPDVTSYAYDDIGMGPRGFEAVSLAEFIGMDPAVIPGAEVKGVFNDCEAGPAPMELSAEEKAELRSLLLYGKVTGKSDCIETTGGSSTYYFSALDGTQLGLINIEDGLLARSDGRYFISR